MISQVLNDKSYIPEQCEKCQHLQFCFDHCCCKHKPCNDRVETLSTDEIEIRRV